MAVAQSHKCEQVDRSINMNTLARLRTLPLREFGTYRGLFELQIV
jgi:hypothetical protein